MARIFGDAPPIAERGGFGAPAQRILGRNGIEVKQGEGNDPIYISLNSSNLSNFANDAAAASGGVPVGSLYRNGSVVMVRVA